MSVIVIDPSARNLPEQVLKNTQDLNDLQTAIDELTKVLPDIMGRSPATYVARVLLDSEAQPSGQYHLLFANTSYDVKNGDYVFCVFVHAASGSSYVGVLQVVNDTYASGQYAATVTAVTPNLRGNDGATGPAGQPGETGPAGETQLLYIGPNIGSAVNTNPDTVVGGTIASLSRKPVVGERFLMPVEVGATGASDKIIMIVYVEVTSVGSLSPTWNGKIVAGANSIPVSISQSANPSVAGHQNNIFNVKNTFRFVYQDAQFRTENITFGIPLKATDGIVADVSEDGKFIELHAELYRHHIRFTNGMGMSFNFDIYNRSATQFTYDTLKSYLTGKTYPISGSESMSSTKIPSHIATLNNVITVTYTDTSRYQLEETSVATDDTVEEI